MSATPDTTYLGLAMLIAEAEEGQYEPVSVVTTVGEAREIARSDMASRMRRLEKGESPLCPCAYKVWARRADGRQAIVATIPA